MRDPYGRKINYMRISITVPLLYAGGYRKHTCEGNTEF